jgi:membrane-associated protease RseP (regulator of RpoE activity)
VVQAQDPATGQARRTFAITLDGPSHAADDDAPKIGVTVGPVDDVLRAQLGLPAGSGIVVTEVLPESPAQRGGVEAHDVLVSAAGQNVSSEDELALRLREAKPVGHPLQLRLIRKGQPVEVSVVPLKPAKKPPVPPTPATKAEPAGPQYRLGVQIAAADQTLREQLSLADSGVVVLQVLPKTPAERQGLHAYDVITRAAGRPVRDERDLKEAVQAAKENKLELEYVRGGKREYIAIAPEVAPPEPQASAAGLPPGHPRELLVLPQGTYSKDGEHVLLWKAVPQQLQSQPGGAGEKADGSTAEQLERVNAEIQKLQAEIENVRARIAAEDQAKKAREAQGEKK